MGELDRRAIDTVRVLAMDAVQKAGNGHPGTAMSMGPTAYLLFQKWLRHDPGDPRWAGRDRFVLSMGHSSLTLYIQLFLSGYGLELSDLEALRTWGSRTPGHPEVNHTPGVETTTGPLGQGVGNAVGMAMAARRERGLLDPDAPAGESVFDHTVWAFASDGDLEEGVSGEASSLAGTQELGNLVLVPIPGLDFVRPADANETAVAWRTILEHNDRPAGLSLSRQNLPVFDRTEFASAEGVARGGYVLAEASGGTPEVILIGTGSEVQIAVAARQVLEADGVPARVVSLPCWEWFAAQDRAYREQVLPPTVRARVSVEAGVPMGWREFVGDAGRIVGLNHFGASAAYTVLYEQFGLTADAVVAAARDSLAAAGAPPTAPTGPDSAGVLHAPTGDR
jgi:transketolase